MGDKRLVSVGAGVETGAGSVFTTGTGDIWQPLSDVVAAGATVGLLLLLVDVAALVGAILAPAPAVFFCLAAAHVGCVCVDAVLEVGGCGACCWDWLALVAQFEEDTVGVITGFGRMFDGFSVIIWFPL